MGYHHVNHFTFKLPTLAGGPDPVEGRLMWVAVLLLALLLPNPGFFTVDEWSFLIPPNAESAAVKP